MLANGNAAQTLRSASSPAASAAPPARRAARWALTAALGLGLAAATAVPAPASPDVPPLVTTPVAHVNTLSGTGDGGTVVGSINNFPGAAVPFGMVQFSPDNNSRGQGYFYGDTTFRGFGLNHASQGCGAFGDIAILPTTANNDAANSPWNARSTIAHDSTEVGQPGYYTVRTTDTRGSTVTSAISATTRTGVATFTYPGSPSSKIFIKANQSSSGNYASSITYDAATRTVTGWSEKGGFCGKNNRYRVYFAATFDTNPGTTWGIWNNGTMVAVGGASTTSGTTTATSNVEVGAYFAFGAATQVTMKVALSYVSTDGAIANMNTEVPTLGSGTLATVVAAAQAQWNDYLGRIQIPSGADADDVTTFYDSLYRSLLHPNVFDDVDGRYLGFEATPVVHNVSEMPAAEGGRVRHQYANFSDWDTYRTLAPLQALLYPEEASDFAQSLVNDATQAGSYPRWAMANASTGQMSGDNASALIAQTYVFGARDFDAAGALALSVEQTIGTTAGQYTGGTNTAAIARPGAVIYNERHYAPQVKELQTDHAVTGASVTEEWSIDDFAIGQLAAALGQTALAAQFQERSTWWQNLFNPSNRYIQPKDYRGKFPEGDPLVTPTDFGYRGYVSGFGQVGFDEGNAEQYVWLVPQDMQSLINALGGRDVVAARLDQFMTGGYNVGANVPNMWAGNEPNFNVPWLYNYIGRPWRTQEVVDEIADQLFGPNPDGAEPGNDDLGAQSSWYVWAALGIYPATPGTDVMTVNTPLFEHAVLHLPGSKTLTITAAGAAAGARYIAGLAVNGTATDATWFDLSEATGPAAATLDFTVQASRDMTWGTAAASAPPSYSTGAHAIAAYAQPVGNDRPAITALVPGGAAATATVDVQRIASTAAGFTVAVDAPAGVTITQTGGGAFDATGYGQATFEVVAAASAVGGYYEVPFTVTDAAGGEATTSLTLHVAAPGSWEAQLTLAGTAYASSGTGSFDGAGNTYRRDELEALGLTPGSTHTVTDSTGQSATFTWPDVPDGLPDTMATTGQTITLARPAGTIAFIGASTNGGSTDQALVRAYSKAGKLTYGLADISLGDWVKPSSTGNIADGTLTPAYGNSVIAWTPVRNATSSDPGAYVFGTVLFQAPAGLRITSITLPTNSKLRVFAIAQDDPTLRVAVASAAAGSSVRVTGTGYGPGEAVEVTLDGPDEGTFTVEASALGVLDAQVELPQALTPGAYTMGAASAFGGRPATPAALTVTAYEPPPEPSPTPSPTTTPPTDPTTPAPTDPGAATDPTGGATGPAGDATSPGAAAPDATGPATAATTPAATKVTVKLIKVSGKRFARGTRPAVTVTLKLAKGKPQGKVALYVGKKKVKTITLKGRTKVTVRLPKKYTRAIRVKAVFTPSKPAAVAKATSKTVTLKVKK